MDAFSNSGDFDNDYGFGQQRFRQQFRQNHRVRNSRKRSSRKTIVIIGLIILLLIVILAGGVYLATSYYVQNYLMQPDDIPYGKPTINVSATPTNLSDVKQITILVFDKNGNAKAGPTCFINTRTVLTLKDEQVPTPWWGLATIFGGYQGVKLIEIDGCSSTKTKARNNKSFPHHIHGSDGSSQILQTTISSFDGNQPIDAYAAQCGLVVDGSTQGSCH
jgi:uncharacterized protein YxeA